MKIKEIEGTRRKDMMAVKIALAALVEKMITSKKVSFESVTAGFIEIAMTLIKADEMVKNNKEVTREYLRYMRDVLEKLDEIENQDAKMLLDLLNDDHKGDDLFDKLL